MPNQTRKAIALMSGGLDSLLAAKVIQDQGVEVIGLHLLSPFGCREDVEKSAQALGIRLICRDKGEAYLDLVANPKYGYGKSVNPCVDCRIYMFQIAEIVMQEEGADFVVTGEVLGQRPMSQQRTAMELIDRKSPLEDRILRPLSAHLFEPTLPEREGWVSREALYGVQGRSRREQLDMAERLNLTAFSAPGGGCLLTEMAFAPRFKDFFAHAHYATTEEKLIQSELLRHGRHFRSSPRAKIIVARDQKENELLESKWRPAGGTLFYPIGFGGPSVLALGTVEEEEKRLIGEVILRYGKVKADENPQIAFEARDGQGVYPVTKPISDEQLGELRL
jgi:tRNA-specific 2-thiouridylase